MGFELHYSELRKRREIEKVGGCTTAADPVRQYADDVLSGREIAGPHVRAACERHIKDLDEGHRRGLLWDWSEGERVVGYFAEVLRLSGGAFEGKPFKLAPPQVFIVGSLYGWINTRADCRRFTTAYVETSKGAGKTPLAAGIGLYMATADGERLAEVYVAAVDRDQAKIAFRDAVAMVDQSPALSARIIKSGGKDGDITKTWNLAHLESGSFFRPISSERRGRGKSGFRPYCVILDELHEHPTDAMTEFTRKNIKGRPNALVFMITNAGVYDVSGVCWRYHDYGVRVASGEISDDEFFSYICALDKGDSWTDPAVWKKVSPLLGVTPRREYLEKEVREAVNMPAKQSLTRRLNFCEWVESASPFVATEVWKANNATVDEASLLGRECYGGLDLSGKNALSALVLIFPSEDGPTAVLSFFWAPEIGLRQREERDGGGYRQWADEGYLTLTPGKTVDYRFIAAELARLSTRYRIAGVAFDRWRIEDLERELDDIGADVPLKQNDQGAVSMDPCIEALEDMLIDQQLAHGDNPVLTWCVHNVRVNVNARGLRTFDKREQSRRNDGAVALAMACGLARSGGDAASVYDTRGVLTL